MHTFLFEEGTWRAQGEYRDAGGNAAPVDGETSIRHEEARWLFEGVLRVRGERPALHHNRYEIAPFSPGARSTHWSSNNPAVGALRGRFVLAGDAILSFYASPTGRYRGFECIQRRDETRYSVRGTLLEEDKVLSSWALELTRL
ncbi:MAG: hypothetical protein A3G81_09770 [Betaproteobacteria bacterium RIFCSPLOWO2_12_FULL_65_14]|nr:MAG: hypothetical protein A3G81_09770 [Betaproteobacteria bacterium RIFCSPLOWO2_12_FULL_65_14]